MKFSKLSKILIVVLLVSVLAISLIACSTSKNNKDEKQSIDSSSSTLMATEPNSADEASKLYNQLMEKENEILSTDKALWEKVFMASNKDTPMIEDGTNYGDFLLKTIEGAKDQFTDEEYKKLVAGAEQIKEIEGKLTILEQKYPECANAPSNGDSVPADSNGVISKGGGATSFPSFDGKDLDGNDIKSSDFFKSNNVTVVNYWFSTCKPCVGELPELEALNKKLAEKGGQVVGINSAKMSSSVSSSGATIEGIGFAIPMTEAREIVDDLINYGYVTGRPQLGISCQDVSEAVSQAYNLPIGAYVISVTDGGAAAEAGLQVGDVITAINDNKIETTEELNNYKNEYNAGDTVTLTIVRNGQEQKVSVVLQEVQQKKQS